MQVIVDGLLIDYQREGKGKAVILLHGWNDSAKGFNDLRKHLAKKYLVITPDLPGFGASQAPNTVWGLNDYADFVKEFVSKLGIGDIYAIIGHSNGGAIAIRGLASGRLKASKLVLLDSAGIRGKDKGKLTAIRLATKAGKVILLPMPNYIKARIRRKLYTQIGSDMLAAEHLTDSFKKIVADDVQKSAASLDLPTLIIYGEVDLQTPVGYGELFHQLIKDSTMEVLPRAGHFVHQDRPADVVRLIMDYL